MHQDVAALLAVQDDDVAIHELETRLAALRPRLEAMASERDKALVALQQARQTAESEERRRQEVAARVGAAPRVARKESVGAQQRDVDARSDGRNGAARANQAHDRRRRARAVADRAAPGRSQPPRRRPRRACRAARDGADGGARVALRRPNQHRSGARELRARRARTRRRRCRARSCRATSAFARANAYTPCFRSAARRAGTATRCFRSSGEA